MPVLSNISGRGRDFAQLAGAINAIRAHLAGYYQLSTAGSLSVGTGLHTEQVDGAWLDEVDFLLTTAPTGAALVFDVMTSIDGTHFSSATGGAGVVIPAGVTAATITSFANPVLEAPPGGSPTIRIDVVQVGSSVAGAGLTVTVSTGPF